MANGGKKRSEFVQWMGPILDALRSLGGSAKPSEVCSWIAQEVKLPNKELEETLQSGQTRFYNQVHWARQYLVWEGLLDGSRRGVWGLTTEGWKAHVTEEGARKICLKWIQIHATARKNAKNDVAENGEQDEELVDVPPEEVYEEELLAVLLALSPAAFERVCKRLLRESGFENVEVTGKSHDGGIDGIGIVKINPFVSFTSCIPMQAV